jgi:signal transduction histidine kinase
MIDGLTVDGRPVAHAGTVVGTVTLSPGRHRLELDFTAAALRNPHQVRFRYRLEGLETDWAETDRRSVAYSSPAPGRYLFRVSAARHGGDFDPTGASLAFVIPPRLHERPLVRAGLLVLLAAVVPMSIHVARSRRARARVALVGAERARIARDLHDTLEQGFTAAALHMKAAEQQLPSDAPARKHLATARQIVRHVHSDAHHFIWDLREGGPGDETLPAALARVLKEVQATNQLHIALAVEGKPRPLEAAVETTLFRIAQEALTNTLKHAAATRVDVTLTYDQDAVTLTVIDDGRGMPAEPGGARHLGLIGMQERAERIGAAVAISSGPAGGVKVEVRAPGAHGHG